jgi:rsbT co-antagonist protein RsbR
MTSESPSQLVAQLQERVSRLEEELQQYRAPKIDSNAPQQFGYLNAVVWFEQWLEVAPDPTLLMNDQGAIIQANSQLLQLFGYERHELIDQSIEILVPPEARSKHVHLRSNYVNTPRTRAMAQGLDLVGRHKDGFDIPVEVSLSPMSTDIGQIVIGSIRNITDRRQAEQDRLNTEVIRMQRARLQELSTPLLPINDDIVVMPLIGTIDEDRAQQVIETLLYGITTHQASIALIDITGVPTLDAKVANSLLLCTQAAQLLGAHVVLTGISSASAQILVELDISLDSVVTHASLQSGIAYALQRSDNKDL